MADIYVNWKVSCQVCEQTPTVSDTGLCGVCCFGSASEIDWWKDVRPIATPEGGEKCKTCCHLDLICSKGKHTDNNGECAYYLLAPPPPVEQEPVGNCSKCGGIVYLDLERSGETPEYYCEHCCEAHAPTVEPDRVIEDKAKDRKHLIQGLADEIRKIPRAIKVIESDTRYLANTRIKDITRHLRDARTLILDAPRKEQTDDQ